MADAVRAGGAEQRSYARWREGMARGSRSAAPRGLAGDALEKAVMALARTNPEYVVVGP